MIDNLQYYKYFVTGKVNTGRRIILFKTDDKLKAEEKRKQLIKENYYAKILIKGSPNKKIKYNKKKTNKKKRKKYIDIQLNDIISFDDEILLNVYFKIKNNKYKFYFCGKELNNRKVTINGTKFGNIKNLEINNDIKKKFLLLNDLFLEEWILSSRFYSSKITNSEKTIIKTLDELNIKYITHPILSLSKTKFIIPDFLLIGEKLIILEIDDISHDKRIEYDRERPKFNWYWVRSIEDQR